MAKKEAPQIVRCRYPKCRNLHESNELLKNEAFWDGKGRYYHPDCYHIMQTTITIRDLFCQKVNRLLTGPQVGQLISTIHNLVFKKGLDIDYVLFAVEYMIKNKPGKLRFPAGLYYTVQDKEILNAWNKIKEAKIRQEMKEAFSDINVDDVGEIGEWTIGEETPNTFKSNNNSRFSRVIGA